MREAPTTPRSTTGGASGTIGWGRSEAEPRGASRAAAVASAVAVRRARTPKHHRDRDLRLSETSSVTSTSRRSTCAGRRILTSCPPYCNGECHRRASATHPRLSFRPSRSGGARSATSCRAPAWSVPPSRAIASMSRWFGWPSFSCVQRSPRRSVEVAERSPPGFGGSRVHPRARAAPEGAVAAAAALRHCRRGRGLRVGGVERRRVGIDRDLPPVGRVLRPDTFGWRQTAALRRHLGAAGSRPRSPSTAGAERAPRARPGLRPPWSSYRCPCVVVDIAVDAGASSRATR